jgi:hypothetical protein
VKLQAGNYERLETTYSMIHYGCMVLHAIILNVRPKLDILAMHPQIYGRNKI